MPAPRLVLRLALGAIGECIQGLTALFARFELLTTLLWLRLESRKIGQVLADRIGVKSKTIFFEYKGPREFPAALFVFFAGRILPEDYI